MGSIIVSIILLHDGRLGNQVQDYSYKAKPRECVPTLWLLQKYCFIQYIFETLPLDHDIILGLIPRPSAVGGIQGLGMRLVA